MRGTQTSVLFLSGLYAPEDGSRLYRCEYHAKQLRNAGLKAQVVSDYDATVDMVLAADIIVMARCKFSEANLALARAARNAGKLLCGELDDKIFEPWDVGTSGFLRSKALITRDLPATSRTAGGEHRILGMLPLFDLVLVSTSAIKDALADLGIPAYVARNAFDTDVARPIKRERTELKRILVMSGTKTHDADLRLIALPLARFLYENPAIQCTFLGPFRIPSPFFGLPNIERQERLPVAELYPYIAKHDLCLVPLENTVFNDCKSAIKFVECGLVSVPVVASPRREFRDVIRDGETGFLAADDPDAWYRLFYELRDQPERIRITAANAHQSVLAGHTVTSRGSTLGDTLVSWLHSHASISPSVRRVI